MALDVLASFCIVDWFGKPVTSDLRATAYVRVLAESTLTDDNTLMQAIGSSISMG
jgi:hypothetical protein